MFRGLCFRTALLAVALGPYARAAEPPSALSSGFDDAKLAIKIKAALGADRDLAGSNLFVSVLDGVAAVQGPVPGEAVKERVNAVVRAVPGVTTVKIDCFVVAAEDPLKNEIALRLSPVPKPGPATAIPVATGGLPSVAVAPPSVVPALPRPADDLPSAFASAAVVTVQRPTEPAGPLTPGGLLGAPVASSAIVDTIVVSPLPPGPTAPRPYPTIPPPNVPILPVGLRPASAEDVAFAVVDLRKGDPRYSGLTATVFDGVVTVTGSANGELKDAFAAAVRGIAGVGRVDVK